MVKQLFYSAIFILFSTTGWSQDSLSIKKVDRIIMVSGEIKEGSVHAISENNIQFVHSGESLEYTLKISEIGKIEFSSGRIQQFNKIVKPEDSKSEMIDHHNKIAILPVIYVRDGKQQHGDVMEGKAQQSFFQSMNDHVGYMVIQEPSKTNASLKQSSISMYELNGYTMPEIANALGVEYVVKTILTISEKGVKNYTSNSGNVSSNSRGLHSYSSSSTSTIQYQTTVEVIIYNDHGEQMFSKNKISFFQTADAYPLTLRSIIKNNTFLHKIITQKIKV